MSHGTHAPAVSHRQPSSPIKPGAHAGLHHIILTLARCPEHPDGSAGRGYEIVAPLGPDGRLDAALWHTTRDYCRVRRFWTGEPDRHGRLAHRAGGEGGATWLIDYDDRTDADEEPGYRLGSHTFIEGEYVSIRDAEEHVDHTFRIVQIRATSAGHSD